ncbi:DUF7927 domain-containing protein [Cellulosimicrobium marinum]|uniref:DUF7927 domain-containing protein n=1 Tax=Cellulosimicrobium marinum TaxID=1638992 RepID=UPI001E4FD1B9|nr:GEVED domain-containing protein [Cellulosimicrobium marinum]MCB7135723.1 DUF11 domain-containing protein [Cellulosimicrobium marinum]
MAGTLVLAAGLTAVPVAAPWVPESAAVPGSPGVMEAPRVFFVETFENVTWQEPDEAGPGSNGNDWDAGDYVQTLTPFPVGANGSEANYQPGYVNADGVTTYTADSDWAAGNYCNGIIVSAHGTVSYQANTFDSPRPQFWPDPLLNPSDGCIPTGTQPDNAWWNRLRSMARAMGEWHATPRYPYLGSVPADTPATNHLVSSYTNVGTGQTIEPGSMLELAQPLAVDPGRYFQFSIDVASQSCNVAGAVGAEPQFLITQADGSTTSAFSAPVDTCVVPRDAPYGLVVPAASATNQTRQTRVGTWIGDIAVRSTGDSIGVRIVNEQGSGTGNDTAFDNLLVLDTTPKLDKEFSSGLHVVGSVATLTFTVTNTYDLIAGQGTPSGPKEDFSFTDVFADDDLVLTGDASTTCGDGVVTADAGTGTVALTGGDLVAPNLASCTVTVGVTSDVPGTYTNGPDDLTELVGLDPPGTTDVTFEPLDPPQCPAAAQLWQFVGSPPTTVYDVDLVTGGYVDRGKVPQYGVNAVGYNPVDGFAYGALVAGQSSNPPELIRTSPDLQAQTNLGQPGFSGVGFGPGNLVSTEFNIGDVSPDGVWYGSTSQGGPASWIAVDVDPVSPTFMQVLAGDTSYSTPAANLVSGADWSYYDGRLYSVGYNANQNPRATVLFSLDPSTGTANMQALAGYGAIAAPNGVNPSNQPGAGAAWGATYLDDAGYLYASNNGTGQIWRFDLDAPARPPTFFAYGPASTGNDGSRCPGPVPVDLGDAPASYGTTFGADGARHGVAGYVSATQTAPLMLGTRVDAEDDGAPSPGADGDDGAGVDDEDGLAGPSTALVGEPLVRDVTATNDTATDATLVAWFDADLDGTFDPDEASAAVTVPAGSGTDVYPVTLPAPDAEGDTFVRLRLFAGANPGPQPVGAWDGGEVEDHAVEVVDLPLDLGDAPDSYGTLLASDGARHAVVDHDAASSTAPLMLGDANTVDTESDGAPSAGADGDDLAGVDDEGAVAGPVTAEIGEDLVVDVVATNDSTTDATLVAWLDADLDGAFGADEASAAVTVPAASGSATYPVTVPAPGVLGDSYLRVRLFAGANADPQPTGAWTGGEVEDHVVTVVERELTVAKTSDAGPTAQPGNVVEYAITVENTGGVDYTASDPASVTDDLADVLDDATYGDDATVDPDRGAVDVVGTTLTWEGPLAVGESVTITYTVTVDDPPGGDGVLSNTVVAPGSTCDPDVEPADPACTVTTPVRSLAIEKTSEPVTTLVPGQVIQYSFTVENTGGYDYTLADPAVVDDDLAAVLDDAQYGGDATVVPAQGTVSYADGTLTWSGPLAAGESVTVTYSVTVDDPVTGDSVLRNVVEGPPESTCAPGDDPVDPDCVVVLPAPGLGIVKTAEPSSDPLLPGGTVSYTVEVTNTGATDYTDDAPAEVTDDLAGVLDDAGYDGGATVDPDQGTLDVTGTELRWFGPLGAGETVTLTYSVTVDDPPGGDGVLTNAVLGPPESNCAPGSTDPGCATTTPVRWLEIAKTSDAPAALLPGDTITYTVEVTNPSTVAYPADDPVTVTDDLAGVVDDGTLDENSFTASSDSGGTPPLPTWAPTTLTWSGPVAAGETVTLTYAVTVGDPLPEDGDAVLTNAVTGPPESTCPDGDDPADPVCSTTTPVRAVQIVKTAGSLGDVVPGSTVTYTLDVTNTGGVDYTDPGSLLTVSDDLTEVLDDATVAPGSIVVEPDQGEATFTDPTLTWTGPLAIGETVTITYAVTVDDPLPDDGDGVLTNAVTGPPESNCDEDADPADPDCSTTTPVRSLGIVKTSRATGAVLPGDEVTYTIEVTNTGGTDYTFLDPAVVSDDLGDVLDDATFGTVTTDPSPPDAEFDADTEAITWSGALAAGATVTITYTVTVDAPLSGDGLLDNTVVGPPESPCDPAQLPADPGCTVTLPVRAVEVVKSVEPADGVPLGDEVTYTVEITNTGQAAYTDPDSLLTVTDDLSAVLDDATWDGDVTVEPDQGEASFTAPDLTWTGPLAVDETVTLTYTLTVTDPLSGDGTLTNAVVGPPESTCPEDADPVDPGCTTEVPVLEPGLGLTKTSDAGDTVLPGDTVTYTVTVENTGEVDYTADAPASFTDDLADVLDDAAFEDGSVVVAPDQGTAARDGDALSWSGPLAVGDTVTVTYSVTVGAPLPEGGDGVLTNTVTGPPESSCVAGTEEGCTVTDPVRQLDLVKEKVSPDEDDITPGEVLTYAVTVTNTGGFDYTEDDPATWDDDLSGVLDDATYAGDATATPDQGAVTDDGSTLRWSGPLAVGESVTVTYTVQVNDPLSGDGVLGNVVTGPPESTCADPSAPGCTVVVPSRQLEVTKTAEPDGPVVPGGTVTYTVTVTNLSQAPYTQEFPAAVIDDLTGVLDDAAYGGDARVEPDGGTLVWAAPRLVWVGPLAGGESVEITYSVTVDDPVTGDGVLDNVVFEPPAPPTCADGTCGPTLPPTPPCVDGVDPDTGRPCAGTRTPVGALTIEKSVTTQGGEDWAGPTQDVTYTVTVTNTGAADYAASAPAVVSDDLSDVLDDATLDAASVGVAPDQGAVAVDGTTLTWTGPLAVGASVTITYTVTVTDTVSGDGDLVNVVTGPPESTCADGSDEGCTTTTPVRALEIVKTSDAGDEVQPGDVVAYTVVVTNTGTFVYTDDDPAEVTDDLSAVLDDAAWNDDAAAAPDVGAVAFAEPELTWSGPLDPGADVTLTYSVTVNAPATGDGQLDNVVTGPPESTCAVDPSMSPVGMSAAAAVPLPTLLASVNPDCSTTVPVVVPPAAPPVEPALPVEPGPGTTPQGSLPQTGGQWNGLVATALVLILLGGLLAGTRLRSARRDT